MRRVPLRDHGGGTTASLHGPPPRPMCCNLRLFGRLLFDERGCLTKTELQRGTKLGVFLEVLWIYKASVVPSMARFRWWEAPFRIISLSITSAQIPLNILSKPLPVHSYIQTLNKDLQNLHNSHHAYCRRPGPPRHSNPACTGQLVQGVQRHRHGLVSRFNLSKSFAA